MCTVPLLLAAAVLGQPIHVSLRPVEAGRDAPVRIAVTHVDAARLQARLLGAQTGAGKAMPWVALVRATAQRWQGTLRTPHSWGVYPVQLRLPGASRTTADVVKVLPAGFRARPSFATAAGAAAWWVRTGPPRATLLSAEPWRAPPGTPRNAYNRLLVVELRLLAPWPPVWPKPGRLTMFVSATRESLHGRWRFVDVGTGP